MYDAAVFVDEHNNRYHFRVDGHSIRIYAECFESAFKKLQAIYPNMKGTR